MATEKSPAEGAKTLDDSNDSRQNGSNASVAKPNGSKPNGAKSSVGEIRKRAYELFQERQGGSELGDWQKAEASVSADAAKAERAKADTSKADAPKQTRPRLTVPKPKRPRPMRLRRMRPKCVAGTD